MKGNKLIKIIKDNKYIRAILFPVILIRRYFMARKDVWQDEIIRNIEELIVIDPIMKLEEFKGTFSINPHSDLFKTILKSKRYEPKLVKYCEKYINPERDVIDIGANIGFYTVLFSKLLLDRKVLAIEPTQNALIKLRQNIELNEVGKNVVIYEGVVSDTRGTAEIKTIIGKEEYSSMGVMDHPSIAKETYTIESVMSSTLDELVDSLSIDPGFIKIDVEGAEALVFKGASKTLQLKRPVILSKLNDYLLKRNGSSASEVIKMIEGYDYQVIDPLNPSIPAGKKAFGDILCIPNENIN